MIRSEKGGLFGMFNGMSLILKIIIVVVIAVLIIPGLMTVSPIVKYVMMAFLVFFLYEFVAKALGSNNILTFIVTGVLAYFVIYKYLYLSTSLMMMYVFLMFGLMSVFVWGTSSLSRKK
jgi:hypothetical protein